MSRRRILLTTLFAVFFGLLAMLYSRLINPQIFRAPASFFKFGTQSTTAAAAAATSMAHSSPIPGPVIIVGSGLAGLCASYEALRAGAQVRMLDRAAKPGGNSIKASSGINGAGSRFQKAKGITDDSFKADTIKSAGKRYREWEATEKGVDRGGLVNLLTSSSAGSVEWLVDEVGVELSVVAMLGGHSVARTHRGAGKLPPGAALVTAFLNKLKEDPNFELKSGAEVTKIEQKDGAVIGVGFTLEGETHHLEGPVIFATGGFAGDANGQLAQYRPDLKGMPATAESRPGTHALLTSAGAALVDMDSVQIHPTGFVDPAAPVSMSKFLAAEMLRGEGGILLDTSGKRFINELQTRDRLSEAIMAFSPSTDNDAIRQWDVTLLLDPGAAEAASTHLGFYMWKGLMQKKKVKDLNEAVIKSIDEYAGMVASKTADPLGRKDFGHWTLVAGEANREEEVVVGNITPVVHFTMGGVAFNGKAQVLREDLEPITGLFAAGEVTGGLHGDNRLGGSSLLECVVYGRIAGKEAARMVV